MSKWSLRHRTSFICSVPAPLTEIRDGNPRLVDVHDMCPFTVKLKHLACVEMAKHFASFRISCMGNSFDATIA